MDSKRLENNNLPLNLKPCGNRKRLCLQQHTRLPAKRAPLKGQQ